MMSQTDLNTWTQWAESAAWAHLKSKKRDLGCQGGFRNILGERLCRWLLDEDRWRNSQFGNYWGQTSMAGSREFIIRSVESWPDENVLAELADACAQGVHPPPLPPRDGCVDLFAWWIIVDRGQNPLQPLRPEDVAHQTYGLATVTRVGQAVFLGLKDEKFTVGVCGCAPRLREAYGEIFDTSLHGTCEHFYRDGWKILEVASKYEADRGDVWGYLHTCIVNWISDFLELKCSKISVPTIHIADYFRLILARAAREIGQTCGLDDDGDDLLSALHAVDPGNSTGSNEDDPLIVRLRECVDKVLSSCRPVERIVFLLTYVPPERWSREAVAKHAADLGVPAEALVSLLCKMGDRIELTGLRLEACEFKRQYISDLLDATRQHLEQLLVEDGLPSHEAQYQIAHWNDEADSGQVRLQDLEKVLTRSSIRTREYLAARLQKLVIQLRRLAGYVQKYTDEWNRRHEFTPEEIGLLAEIIGCKSADIRQHQNTVFGRLVECMGPAVEECEQ